MGVLIGLIEPLERWLVHVLFEFVQYVMSAMSARVLMSAGCDVQGGGCGRAQPSVKWDNHVKD